MEWIKMSISPVKELVAFLHQKSKTNDVHKKHLLIELRNNLNVFSNAFLNEVSYDILIELIRNDAIQAAIKDNFNFRKLKAGDIEAVHIMDDRNRKYLGWNAERLFDKIDEKIVELRNIRVMNGSLARCRNNIPLMMGNLYFRMKLLADFIRSDETLSVLAETRRVAIAAAAAELAMLEIAQLPTAGTGQAGLPALQESADQGE